MTNKQFHWTEYFCEAALLGAFMFSACLFTLLLEHPAALANAWLPNAMERRIVMGCAMGLTAIGLIFSPLGQRSGAHFNPAVTLTYWTLGRIHAKDVAFYVAFQFLGGITGVALADALFGDLLSDPAVNHAATLPGLPGPGVAFLAETIISFLLMSVVLRFSNSKRLTQYTPFAAGTLVALFITFEAPLSGMSMNPARTTGSALVAGAPLWPAIYFIAPVLGMLAAALVYRLERGARRVYCAKLHHANQTPCIFLCNYGALND